ncbi:MAG: sulfite exporter TauE/SafE family protein [Calditrichaeota bacterium]|nr:MAG: sulfite exporter TauE/SafE family protein [Calditrichota bacterium]
MEQELLHTLFIALVAGAVSLSTLFSGFGLGTLLLPAFALFFPAPVAVALTAIVHFLNNLFKWVLLGRYTNWSVVARFGLPAILAAALGAWTLGQMSHLSPIYQYRFLGKEHQVFPVNVLIGLLMLAFALVELTGLLREQHLPARWLPLGGLLSGFFGGLSGHQGALRSAFLLHAGLEKEAYIATGVTIACLVDVVRISIYSSTLLMETLHQHALLMVTAVGSAFLGAFVGARLLRKVTFRLVRRIVSVFLIGIALGLIAGFV